MIDVSSERNGYVSAVGAPENRKVAAHRDSRPASRPGAQRGRSMLVTFAIGVGIMAAVDEIVFHQILAWHHFYDQSTPQIGLLSDGLLHTAEIVIIVAGVLRLRRPAPPSRPYYRSVISQVVLLYLRDLFDADELLESVELGGHVHATNRATGQQEYPCLISVAVDRAKFAEISLQQVQAEDCLKYLNALVSRHPHAVESVDSRSDLTAMTATEFEHFVRQVFECMGMQGWTTDRTGDDGVDAVVFNKDPIVGGLTIVQAKKYTRVLGVNHIRELVGAMDEKRAGRAILVTTSGSRAAAGPSARERPDRADRRSSAAALGQGAHGQGRPCRTADRKAT
jgi:restriction system protein